jgi:hypothetical protein
MATIESHYNFPTELCNVYTGNSRVIKGKKGLIRTDTGDCLSIVSDQYQMIQHAELVDSMLPIIQAINPDFQGKSMLDKQGCILNYTATMKDEGYKLKELGEQVGFQVHIRNTYDGTGCASIRLGALVLSCKNGMVKNTPFINIRVIHKNGAKNKFELPSADQLSHHFDNQLNAWDAMGVARLNASNYSTAINSLVKQGLIRNTAQDVAFFMDKRPKTYWEFMQNMTYHLTHERPRLSYDGKLKMLGKANNWFETNYNSMTIN